MAQEVVEAVQRGAVVNDTERCKIGENVPKQTQGLLLNGGIGRGAVFQEWEQEDQSQLTGDVHELPLLGLFLLGLRFDLGLPLEFEALLSGLPQLKEALQAELGPLFHWVSLLNADGLEPRTNGLGAELGPMEELMNLRVEVHVVTLPIWRSEEVGEIGQLILKEHRLFTDTEPREIRGGHLVIQIGPRSLVKWPNVSARSRPTSLRRLVFSGSPLIRMLVEHARDQEDQDVLSYLCSREGGASYLSQVRGPHLCLLDLLLALPSCSPPLERLLEHLPRLQPRPYSAASALGEPSVQHVDFVFNTVDFERSQGRYFARRGLCTGWLEDLHALQPSERPKISIFGRSNQNFRYPLDETTSLIMIGPGTGVAPFRGFMQLRERQQPGLGSQAWLFTGCRHQEKDFLFREDWEKWTEQGVLSQFSPCFSRDEPEAQVRYVQHEIRAQAKAFIDFMERDSQSVILVCGDARNMAKDVQETIVECLVQEKGVSLDDAKSQMADWIIGRRYLQDIWT
eukprot:maker-scaffold507_size152468-snap-gene-0.40 protein:Tk11924 transcript:maker-scaffold507_size152468-snap-gene-0.40-mRNA-1 annotation:"methionine synthase reductase-like isoform x2"